MCRGSWYRPKLNVCALFSQPKSAVPRSAADRTISAGAGAVEGFEAEGVAEVTAGSEAVVVVAVDVGKAVMVVFSEGEGAVAHG